MRCWSLAECEAGCARGDGEACFRLAGFYANGWGVPPDEAREKDLLRRACEHAYAEGCHGLARRPEMIGSPETKALVERGDALAEERCHAGEGDACTAIVRDAVAEGCARRRRACELGSSEACLELTLAPEADVCGTYGDAWQKLFYGALDAECEAGEAARCWQEGSTMISTGKDGYPAQVLGIDVSRARWLLERGATLWEEQCQRGYPPSCIAGARALADARGKLSPDAGARAGRLFVRGCELGDAAACRQAAEGRR